MSIVLNLYSRRNPSPAAIEKILLPLGFKRETTYSKRSSGRSYRTYAWFETKNLASSRGVWLSWARHDGSKDIPAQTKTVFWATTYAGRSYEDVEMQNEVIRKLRSAFGGALFDEWGGRGYLANSIPRFSYAVKLCGWAHIYLDINLDRIRSLVSQESAKRNPVARIEFGARYADISIIRNNVLLPFLVSVLESFLRDVFIALLAGRPKALKLVHERWGKVEYSIPKGLPATENEIADIEAGNFSFRKLESAHAAFERYLGIKLLRLWGKRRRYERRYCIIRDVLQELFNLRNSIVQEADFDPALGRSAIMRYVAFVGHAVEVLKDTLERDRDFRIDLNKFLQRHR